MTEKMGGWVGQSLRTAGQAIFLVRRWGGSGSPSLSLFVSPCRITIGRVSVCNQEGVTADRSSRPRLSQRHQVPRRLWFETWKSLTAVACISAKHNYAIFLGYNLALKTGNGKESYIDAARSHQTVAVYSDAGSLPPPPIYH